MRSAIQLVIRKVVDVMPKTLKQHPKAIRLDRSYQAISIFELTIAAIRRST
ncbi:hypothetical protein NCHU2750_48010 (plasmid) [Neorhizobium sp. NCHU2750]|nr:hypothetical protein NCHU2750_48010 [Neorhizobium sp. NCHU2750]